MREGKIKGATSGGDFSKAQPEGNIHEYGLEAKICCFYYDLIFFLRNYYHLKLI